VILVRPSQVLVRLNMILVLLRSVLVLRNLVLVLPDPKKGSTRSANKSEMIPNFPSPQYCLPTLVAKKHTITRMFVLKQNSMPFYHLDTVLDFLSPLNKQQLGWGEAYKHGQFGHDIEVYEKTFPDIDNADLILLGCDETRGDGMGNNNSATANAIRREFYELYHWHKEVNIVDAGNIKKGASLKDTYAALKTVLKELIVNGKKVLVFGGSHDLALGQYEAYADSEQIIEAVCVDAKIDLDSESRFAADNFLMRMLTEAPNFVRHYSHIGFQSYFVHPGMLETIDRLGFDCFRAGKVKENLEEMEPVIRNANLFTLDISAIQNCYAPANTISPNGLTGEEACILMQYAGMSQNISSIGIYGYMPNRDKNELTAKQISQMAWYLMDGIQKGKQEDPLSQKGSFREYHLAFSEMESTFLQSKKTGRWWMMLPDGKYTACSHNDYAMASQNEIPERWMRAVERS
jgi:arginase family enzyme